MNPTTKKRKPATAGLLSSFGALFVATVLALAPCVTEAQQRPTRPPYNNLNPGNERDRLIDGVPNAKLDLDLLKAIRTVGKAFEQGDETGLDDCLGPHKIFVSIRTSSGGSGYYTRSQLHFILNKIFDERQTREFVFSESDIEMAETNRAFLRSYWTYMVFDSDTMVTEDIRFQFERKGDRWLITEIKASAR